MNAISFLDVTLQVLGAEMAGIATVAIALFGYIKIMSSHNA